MPCRVEPDVDDTLGHVSRVRDGALRLAFARSQQRPRAARSGSAMEPPRAPAVKPLQGARRCVARRRGLSISAIMADMACRLALDAVVADEADDVAIGAGGRPGSARCICGLGFRHGAEPHHLSTGVASNPPAVLSGVELCELFAVSPKRSAGSRQTILKMSRGGKKVQLGPRAVATVKVFALAPCHDT